jgi:4-amino-4-deoxy-L-arabinose transferase-like glycosyltransferase
VVFSIASGIFHPYYLIMLAPPTAALVGIGVSSLWTAYRRREGWRTWLLPVALLATALWQARVLAPYPQWSAWLTPLLLGGSLLAAGGLVAARVVDRLFDGRFWRRWSVVPLGAGLLALLLSPLVWSVTPVLAGPSNASLPVAGPEALNQNDPTSWTRLNDPGNDRLVTYLEENRNGYFYLVAVANSQQASSIALKTGKPVLAAGGFMGSDPALTVEKLQKMIADKQVRFVMGLDGTGMRGGQSSTSVGSWIRSYCTAVDPPLYQGQQGFTGAFGFGNSPLYDCAPQESRQTIW